MIYPRTILTTRIIRGQCHQNQANMDATPGNPLGDSSSAMTEQAAVARPDAVTNEGAASFSTGHAFHEGGIRERISVIFSDRGLNYDV